MIRPEQLVATYQSSYFATHAPTTGAIARQAVVEARTGGVQASPSVKVSLSAEGMALSRSEERPVPVSAAMERHDRELIARQHMERQRSNAKFKGHVAQLEAQTAQADASFHAKWQGRNMAHDAARLQEMAAETARADADRAARNAPPKQSPQVRPMSESASELSKAVAQSMSAPPPGGQKA